MDPLMTFWIFLIGIIVGLLIGLTLVQKVAISPLHNKVENLTKNVYSKEAKEEFFKKLKKNNYPFSLENFRYINNPFDGIQFEEDHILFVSTNKDITPTQKNILRLIKNKKVNWLDFKIS